MTRTEQGAQVLADVLAPVRVTQIVCVDDAYGVPEEPSLEPLLSWIAMELSDGRLDRLITVADKVGNPIFDPDDDGWDQIVRGWWAHAGRVDRDTAVREVSAVLGRSPDFGRERLSRLQDLVQQAENLTLIPLAPADWEAQREELLADATSDERILVLFDQDLTGVGLSTTQGGAYLRDAVRAHGAVENERDRRAFFGLLSDFFGADEEESRWREAAQQHEVPLGAFLPVAKERLDDPKRFAQGIQLALINASHERIKSQVIEITLKGTEEANAALHKLSVRDFDQLVRSSEPQGIWEPETVFRVQRIEERRARLRRARAVRFDLDTETSFIRTVRTVKTVGGGSPTLRVWELQHWEMYDGREINNPFSPLELGDLFETAGAKYILLAQTCDLILRPTRRLVAGTLVPIVETPQSHDRTISPECFHGVHPPDKKRRYFDFRGAVEINLDVLDLCVYREDGVCVMDCSADAPVNLPKPWQARYVELRDRFAALGEAVTTTKSAFEAASTPQEKQNQVLGQLLGSLVLAPGVLTPTYQGGVFSWGVKRVGRLLPPWSDDLLDKYHAFCARVARDHDFTIAPRDG